MTGTAPTEADEFMDIYRLDVVEVPTNMPVVREDEDDEVYRTAGEKYKAIIATIDDCHAAAASRCWSAPPRSRSRKSWPTMLKKARSIPHNVLNARYHEQEAQIIAQAGVPGAVTIATNMAGRGTDIQLGGNADMRIETELAEAADRARARRAARPRSRPRSSASQGEGARRPAACSSSAPSAMRAAASTTSCAAVPAARAIPAARSSICRSRTT